MKISNCWTAVGGWLLVCALLFSLGGCVGRGMTYLDGEGPGVGQRVQLYLEGRSITGKSIMAIEIESEGTRTKIGSREISAALGDPYQKYESFELGMCFAEAAWVSQRMVVIFVKNCLGRKTLIAFDCEKRRAMPGEPYGDSIRTAIRVRYKRELPQNISDPLEWVDTEAAREAFYLRTPVSVKLDLRGAATSLPIRWDL